jgi:hypothetical protein
MFTENLRFFGKILHPQWPVQTSKIGQKNGLGPLGVNTLYVLHFFLHPTPNTYRGPTLHS